MVVIMREERRKVYEYLLEEGVIVLKKDFNLPEHNDTKI
jgi:small subunit ribosomal protein S10e